MMNKNILFVSVMTMVLSVAEIQAQNIVREGDVTIQSNKLEQSGDSLYIDLTFTIKGTNVTSRNSGDFTPVLISEGQSLILPKISIKGRRNYMAYRRKLSMMSKKEEVAYMQNAPYKILRGFEKDEKTVNYQLSVPYEKWMSTAVLNLEKDDCGCGVSRTTNVRMLANKVNLERIIVTERYDITPTPAYIQPKAESMKRRVEQCTAYLNFAVGKSNVNSIIGNNGHELKKIHEMITMVQADKGVEVKGIDITGYASPEGLLASNERLSGARAKLLKEYLQQQYPNIPKNLYAVHFGGENWDDLLSAVKASDMEYKQEVIDIIQGYSIVAGREKKIMDINGGVPYRYMLKEMFPALRKATVAINYNVKDFDLKEAREIVKTRPQNLSLNEMFAVAQTYENGSQEFNDLFETAVRMFPQDVTANINAAVVAIGRRDYVSANRYLKNIEPRVRIPEYDNAMGMLVMMRDADYDKAESYFKSAEQAGLAAATDNLRKIEKMRESVSRTKEIELKNKE